jgi:RNA polymerase primary sigma factor
MAVRRFPFAFGDLVGLVDAVAYAFKAGGGAFKPDCSPSHSPAKKQADIILRRLEGVAKPGNPSLAGQFKEMGLHRHGEQLLSLSTKEMGELLAEVVLAEHYWLACRQQLATANSRLVLFIANQYKGNFMVL